MSAVVKAVSSAVSSVVKFVGKAVESVGRFVGNVVQNALDNPLETLATVAVIALAPYAAPFIGATVATTTAIGMGLVSATSVLAKGGDIGDALKAAALSAGTSWVGSTVGSYIGSAAVQAGASQFVGNTVGTMAGRAVAGAGAAALTGKDIMEGAGSGALQGLVGSLTGAAVKEIGLTNTLTGALGAGAGAYAANAISGGLSGGLNALVRGKDFGVGAQRGIESSVFNRAMGDLAGSAKAYATNVWNTNIAPTLENVSRMRSELSDQGKVIDTGIEQLTDMSKQYDTEYQNTQDIASQAQEHAPEYQKAVEAITPFKEAYDEAKSAYDAQEATARQTYDTLVARKTEYDSLYSQYEAALAANNQEEVTRLENILVPMNDELTRLDDTFGEQQAVLNERTASLNEATENANRVYTEHQTTLERGAQLNQAFENSQNTLQDIQTRATDLQTQLQAQRDTYDRGTADYNARNEELSRQVQDYERFVEAFQSGDEETAEEYRQRTNPFDISIAAQRGAQAEAENPWAEQAALGIQRFDDGSSIQTFDDGSSIVTDSDGRQFTYNERGQAYNADAGLIGAPEQIGPGRFKQTFDDGSYIITDGSGNPIETYDSEGNLYTPGSNPNLPANQRPRSASAQLPTSAASRQNAAMRRSTQTRREAADAARGQATSQEQRRLGQFGRPGQLSDQQAQAADTPGYGLGDLFAGIGATSAPLTEIEGVANIKGQEYRSLDPLDQSYAQQHTEKGNDGEGQNTSLDPFATADIFAPQQPQNRTGALNFLDLDPLAGPAHAAAGGSLRMPRLHSGTSKKTTVYGANRMAVEGGGDGITDSIPTLVRNKSYVVPARAVSEIGNGSSTAGKQRLFQFTHRTGKLGALSRLAGGGVVDDSEPIPARLSQDEFVIPPETVAQIGGGDVDVGAKRLDALMTHIDKRRKGMKGIADDGGDYLGMLTQGAMYGRVI